VRGMPSASVLVRLLAFMVPVVLALSGVQPLFGAAAGAVPADWAIRLSVPALVGAAVVFAGARLLDRGDTVQPPWYSAWVLMPGAFVLAGAAAMCIFGALVQLELIDTTMWLLLVMGVVLWSGALLFVRRASR
jgi:hypothetical protein